MKRDYDTVVFSLYGTLADIRTDENDPALWRDTASFFADNGAYYKEGELQALFKRTVDGEFSSVRERFPYLTHPDIDLRRVFTDLLRRGGASANKHITTDALRFFRERSTRSLELREGAEDCLEALRERGMRLFIFANGQSSFAQRELKELGIDDLFNGVFMSSDYNMAKPEEAFFDGFMEASKPDIEGTLFIGNDYLRDIAPLHKKSMHGVYLITDMSPEYDGKIFADLVIKNGSLTEIKEYLEE